MSSLHVCKYSAVLHVIMSVMNIAHFMVDVTQEGVHAWDWEHDFFQ